MHNIFYSLTVLNVTRSIDLVLILIKMTYLDVTNLSKKQLTEAIESLEEFSVTKSVCDRVSPGNSCKK